MNSLFLMVDRCWHYYDYLMYYHGSIMDHGHGHGHGLSWSMATMAMVKVAQLTIVVLQLTTILQLTSNSLQSHFKLLTYHFTLTSQAHKSLQTHFKLTSNSLHTHTYHYSAYIEESPKSHHLRVLQDRRPIGGKCFVVHRATPKKAGTTASSIQRKSNPHQPHPHPSKIHTLPNINHSPHLAFCF